MRFVANISTFFNDMDLVDRFNEAKESGFSAVEAQWVYDIPFQELITARASADIDCVLINSHKECINWPHAHAPCGFASLPQYEANFRESIFIASRYCDFLRCKKLHIMAGVVPPDTTWEQCELLYKYNLKVASEIVGEYNVTGLIEPICDEVVPNYFMNSFQKAINILDELQCENLKLLLDVFHLYKIEGNVEAGLLRYLPYAGHIQVSQSPARDEPLSKGDIDYERVFEILRENNYDGDIGLEYTPTGDEPDFEWIKRFER